MSTLKTSNIQHASAASAAITLNSSGQATLNGLAYPTAGALSNRNLIINGAMQVAQRGTSVSGLTDSGVYLVDRFAYRRGGSWGTNSFTMSQQSSGAPDGFTHFLRLAQSGTAAAPPTDTFCGLATYLEGNSVYQAGFGTNAAQPLMLSFWARASQSGTYSVALNNNSDQTFIAEYSVTSNWTRFTIPIAARTTGTWGAGNNGSFYIFWTVAADSDGTHSASTGWNETLDYHSSNQIETFASTSGATFDLTGVQLEVGSVATPFEHRSYGDELQRCMRYYQTSYPPGVTPGTASTTAGMVVNQVAGASIQRCTVRMIVPMRSTSGTVVIYNPSTGTTGEVRTNASTNISAGGPYDLGHTAFFIDYTPGAVEFCFWHYTVAMEL